MEYKDIKRDFFRDKLFNHDGDYSMVPERLVNRWDNLWSNPIPITSIPVNPRLMNHYTIGADPEFSLMSKGEYYRATDLNLSAGRAFGADNNGRLVELRPMPSKFALDVVASLLVELQWAARLVPKLVPLDWIAVPYDQQDGLGGHVHFARKRSETDREQDVKGLDHIFGLMMKSGLFNEKICNLRLNRAHYGKYGDVRIQNHGYEYRTFPTWLNNPWMAHLSLVLAKIGVYSPHDVVTLSKKAWENDALAKETIVRLLRYYQTIDDDVRIAYIAYQLHGFPSQEMRDFKLAWGIKNPLVSKQIWYPPMMEPDHLHRQAIFDYLVGNKSIEFIPVEPNWEDFVIPEDYLSLFDVNQTVRQVGIGEICSNLVCHKRSPINLSTQERDDDLIIYLPPSYPVLQQTIQQAVRKFYTEVNLRIIEADVRGPNVLTGKALRTFEGVDVLRQFLLSGVFPCWETTTVKEDSMKEWLTQVEQNKPKFKGVEIV